MRFTVTLIEGLTGHYLKLGMQVGDGDEFPKVNGKHDFKLPHQ